MDPGYEAKYNPWSTDDSAVGLRNALLLAEKTGHVSKRGEIEESLIAKLEEMPSMKMIKLQREISQRNDQLNQVNYDIQKRMLYQETKDITDVGVIEKRTKELKKLSDHLQMIVNSKEYLVTKLQQPFVGEYIKLEAAFHRHASELFTHLAPILSDLTSHLDNLSWVNANTFRQSQLDDLVTEISSGLASIQTNFQSLTHVSQCIHSLHSADVSYNS